MQELKGKVAIVSGATRKRGLGAAIALALARAGANVVVTGSGRSASSAPEDEVKSGWRGLPDLVAAIEALGVRGHGINADATDAGAVQSMVAETIERFGRIDILINNATYPRAADRVPIVDLDETLWRKVIDVNLTGTMIVSKYVAKQMIAQGHGITCNVIAPGFLDTARIDELRTEGKWEKRLSNIPIKRAGTAEEVAELVRFLCGPQARWISGEAIVIAGGEIRRAAR